MKSFFQVIFFGFFFFTLTGCGSTDTSKEKDENIDNSTTKTEFFLDLPSDWISYPESSYTKNIVFASQEPHQGDRIGTNIVVAQENYVPLSLDQFIRRSLENTRLESQDFQVISEEKISLKNGEEAVIIQFSDRNSLDMSRIEFYSLYTLNSEIGKSSVLSISYDPLTSQDHKEFLRYILTTYNVLGVATR